MTEQERGLKYFERQYIDLCKGDLSDVGFECKENTRVAIECIEKQIPKKLKHEVCPNCNTNNDVIIKHLGNPQAHKFVYCWNCGQKLDWGNEDAESNCNN